MAKVIWRGDGAVNITIDGVRLLVEPGDVFEMGQEEAEARGDVELVPVALVVAPVAKPKGKPAQSEEN